MDPIERPRAFSVLLKDAGEKLADAAIDIYHIDQELGVLDDGKGASDIEQTRLSLEALKHDVEAARSRTQLNLRFVENLLARRAQPKPEGRHEFALATPSEKRKRPAKRAVSHPKRGGAR